MEIVETHNLTVNQEFDRHYNAFHKIQRWGPLRKVNNILANRSSKLTFAFFERDTSVIAHIYSASIMDSIQK